LKIYIGVEVYQLIVQDVHLFFKEKEADAWFKKYTGVDHKDFYPDNEPFNEDCDQSKIFEIELPLETILEEEVGRASEVENLGLGKFISNVVERLSKEVIQ